MHKIILIIIAMIINQSVANQDLGIQGIKRGRIGGGDTITKEILKSDLEIGDCTSTSHYPQSNTHTNGVSLELFTNFKPELTSFLNGKGIMTEAFLTRKQ
ncbi:hypothetical protein KCTC52924_00082 [Arenibacter antarcticus]|uniref:Uncharacterized protein n=1 Tax=Arenibacter antarcticus TaxID=2040469 RepID=A0ABW5VND8_9FLAO|nr:hypothetical protein [Arenibacter sp. H213]MCM4169151.1 hypothetical protein [Arenibacter sp. H213]